MCCHGPAGSTAHSTLAYRRRSEQMPAATLRTSWSSAGLSSTRQVSCCMRGRAACSAQLASSALAASVKQLSKLQVGEGEVREAAGQAGVGAAKLM